MTKSGLLELMTHGESSGVVFSLDDTLAGDLAKKIVPLVRQQNGVDPEFVATDDYLLVRMPHGAVSR